MVSRANCRVCLTNDTMMHVVRSAQLQEMYEKLADAKLEADDGRPTMLCYICYAQLLRSHRFWQAVRTSETLLMQLFCDGAVFTQDDLSIIERPQVHSYSVSPIEYVNISNDTHSAESKQSAAIKTEKYDSVLEENKEDIEVIDLPAEVKQDPEYEAYSNTDVQNNSDTDPEDNVPLNKYMKEKVGVQKKRKYNKRNQLDVSEVVLSEEQQIQDVLSRATSENYIQSPYKCTLCYRGFVNHETYTKHKEKHDERCGPHACPVCALRYRTARVLRAHVRTAHARRYTCNTCGHATHTKHQASDHQRWHKGHTYQCQLCSQEFVRTSYLTHVRARHAPAHVCAACGGRYLGAHGLRMHKAKAHAPLPPRQEPEEQSPASSRYCLSCDVQFVSRHAWTRHILNSATHERQMEQTKQCPICFQHIEGSTTDHKKEHAKKLRRPRVTPPVLPGGVRVNCDQCDKTFIDKAKLKAHVRRMHLGLKYNKNIICEVCGKKCTSQAALRTHQRTHTGARPHACPACGRTFRDTHQLRIHARTHTGERPYCCTHCGKRFAQKPPLNRHLRVHTGVKPYTCELCSKSFSQSNSLKVHVRAVHLKMPVYRKKKPAIEFAKSANDVGKSDIDVRKSDNDVGKSGTDLERIALDMKMDQEELIKIN